MKNKLQLPKLPNEVYDNIGELTFETEKKDLETN
jgi:hypothetical protein